MIWVIIAAAVIAFFIFKNKNVISPEKFKKKYDFAMRQVESGASHCEPSWMHNSDKEKQFYDGVIKTIDRSRTPTTYAVEGFISPTSAPFLFSMAAIMERQGAPFVEQQLAASMFITQTWIDMSPDDKESFLKNKGLRGVIGL